MDKLPLTVRHDDLAILVIDVQSYFLDGWMSGTSESLLARLKHLFSLAIAYDLPCLATFEQPVEKMGWMPETLEAAFPAHGQKFTKNTFNCCGEADIREALRSIGRPQFAVAGGETDVCVLRSVLGLLEDEYQVFLLEDCLYSNEPHVGPTIRRIERAGAIPTTVKTLAYELHQSVRYPSEQAMLKQRNPALRLGESEAISDWNPTA